jgi:hypothetical protein
MVEMEELQTRIARALDRITRGVEAWEPDVPSGPEAEPVAPDATVSGSPSPPDDDERARLREALEDEQLANAQLNERLRALQDRRDSESAGLREQVAAQREAIAQLDPELQRLRQANEALRTTSEALREANAQGVGEPHLINKAMLAELESLRAARAAEAKEARLVYDTLQPLLAEAGYAPQPVSEQDTGDMDQRETAQ